MEKSTSSSPLLRLVSTATGDSEAAGRFPSAPRERSAFPAGFQLVPETAASQNSWMGG